ncbi:hypothetical protein [Pseudoalteromonas sp. T1lg75]|uniref:hypothetical protein n=1 Tax=Pseudoalteromonas sp. T1lg75 TaxID=2077102 RepID=UPI000CF6C762|nr:hypothetical protein [Pseudoalteromonas sp. T1lg75]
MSMIKSLLWRKPKARSCKVVDITAVRDNRVLPLELVGQQQMLLTYRYGNELRSQLMPLEPTQEVPRYILADEQGVIATLSQRRLFYVMWALVGAVIALAAVVTLRQ